MNRQITETETNETTTNEEVPYPMSQEDFMKVMIERLLSDTYRYAEVTPEGSMREEGMEEEVWDWRTSQAQLTTNEMNNVMFAANTIVNRLITFKSELS